MNLISSLPDALICHILSFLSTKDAALTSVLSKRWRHLLAFVTNLDLDNTIYDRPKMGRKRRRHLPLERGVVDLDLYISSEHEYPLPPQVLISKTLVKLKLAGTDEFIIDVREVSLPKLKTLHMNDVSFADESGAAFGKLVSGCHVLEELVMVKMTWDFCGACSVSNPTLKRLIIYCEYDDENPESVSLDTPSLVYLELTDTVAAKYPKMNLDSLVEASVGIRMTPDQVFRGRDLVNRHYGYKLRKDVSATDFLMGISHVKILYLSSQALEVLTFCCKVIPVFNNLIHLTIETDQDVDWESLPNLLKNCPNLETLVFEGLHYGDTNQCFDDGYRFKDTNECFVTGADRCVCKPWLGTPSWLSSSPVKKLKVLKFGEITNYKDDMDKQLDLINHFVQTMPNLEEVVLYYDTPFDSDLEIVSNGFQQLEKVASTRCKIQVVSDSISFTTTVHSSSSSSTSGLVFFKNTFPLKILDIDSVVFEEEGVGFARLLSGCPVLEELVLTNMGGKTGSFALLTIFLDDFDENPMSVAFDTPSLEYLKYSDNIAREYPKVNFSSLVEAHIGLRLSEDQKYEEEEKEMVGNATNFLLGLCNVKILYLSAKTLEVFTFCCEATPVFNNLIQLTIESNDESGWDSLPALLPNCPNLETLIFKGLVHKSTDGCGNMCLCKPPKNPSCLSSSAVKVLKIILSVDIDDEGMEMEQIMHFLEKMPWLEQLVVYFNISYDSSVFDLSKKLQSIPRIASPKCNIQVISPNLSLSSTLPSTLSKKWSAPPNEEYSWFLKALKNMDDLPDNLLCQILSNLSTKEAAVTSLLSKRWRHLFALVPNLDFESFSSQHTDHTSFIDFVDRVLKLRGEDHVNKFSLKCGDGFEDEDVYPWISNVLRHGVSDLDLHVSSSLVYWLPSKVFVSKTLVRLKMGPEDGPKVKLRNVCLPKLKTLILDSVVFVEGEIGFAKLLSGCPVLEELSLRNLEWGYWGSCSVASKILKRLTLCCAHCDDNPKSVSFDTPNVVYFKYSDNIAQKYPKLNFDSLVEASIDIRMTNDQKANVRFVSNDDEEEREMVGNATELLMGICNVKTLYLSYDTLETLNFCCEAIPAFSNLTHLTIESNQEVGWESLPELLKNCPNLETLVFQGLTHKATTCDDDDVDMVMEIVMINHFLQKMLNLEQLIVYYNTSIEDDLVEVSSQLQMLPAVASSKCKIQVISVSLGLSVTLPISL
ncbi:hypothetical protein HID58_026603 [Brassica napus]|uniref:F-box domain-containing protein n=1 Tax=Brassica napus TaxID=3708 RepID=A0ABQ8CPG3_BRANA|nr:hypothetical protein HID58_026603 [Brassica napus]